MQGMTFERATELVAKLKGDDKRDLCTYFILTLDIPDEHMNMFAAMCGYQIATQADFPADYN